MLLKQLTLHDFKNYAELAISFEPGINTILGANGSGKTNLLDAIHYLSMTRSAFNANDQLAIRHQEAFFAVQGGFEINGRDVKVICSLQRGQKKQLKLNGTPYQKLSEHIGLIPLVMIAPDDIDLIREGSEFRRRFFDIMISQVDKQYLEQLMTYGRYLKQRNALLKNFAHQLKPDSDIFEAYDTELILRAKAIGERRHQFVDKYWEHFSNAYEQVSNGQEKTQLTYRTSVLDEDYESQFVENRAKDIEMQRTNIGIHKDDFDFKINDLSVKKYASQGQKKSFTIALQLAKYELLKETLNKSPLMLLDDIFDKLDDGRIEALLNIVTSKGFSQLFVTDAREERTIEMFKKLGLSTNILSIENGNLKNNGYEK